MSISIEDAEKALDYLKKTDVEAGRARAYASALDDMRKTVIAMIYNSLDSGSAADKLKKAEGSQDYQEHLEKLRKANEDYYTLNNQRLSAEKQVEMWRSINSNMRRGNV